MNEVQEGREPDYRFTLANERTYLAWMRTAMALLAASVLLHQFAGHMKPAVLGLVLSACLAFASGVIAVGALWQWRQCQLAMRMDQPLPSPLLLKPLSYLVVAMSVATLILSLLT